MITISEFEDAIRLEMEIWQLPEFEALSADALLVASKTGGQVLGAFEQGRMIGFLAAFAGLKPEGHRYIHSHMLGVLPAYQNLGIGRALKLRQRQDALARSLDLIEWTFDPLAIKNAYFNIERLGAMVRRYSLNEYGVTSSGLHGGLPTDRCVAEWWIGSPRVESILAGRPQPPRESKERIEVPAAIEAIRRYDPSHAREIQHRISDQFVACFDSGLAAVGFETSEQGGAYLLAPWDELEKKQGVIEFV